MKNTLQKQLIVIGATQRLEELNKERELLIKIIDANSNKPIQRFKNEAEAPNRVYRPEPRKRLHWTQTPAGKRKMSRIQKKVWNEGRSGIQKKRA